MLINRFLVRNIEAERLLEDFLVSAIASVLVIRLYLQITGFPTIGTGGIHIAHMLWGGLLMLVAIVLMLTFMGKYVHQISAIIGGIGFGAFIDELGKFITQNNDYFFQPAIALIYVVFIALYISFEILKRRDKLTEQEYIVNALEMAKEAAHKDLDTGEKQRALKLLAKCNQKDSFVASIKSMLEKIDSIPEPKPNMISLATRHLHNSYLSLIKREWFIKVVIVFFVIHTGVSVIGSLLNITSPFFISKWGELVSAMAAGGFVLLGGILIKRSRIKAYQMFKYALLISIFLTQFFRFYSEQLSAVVGLFVNIIVLVTLQYMIDEEDRINKNSK